MKKLLFFVVVLVMLTLASCARVTVVISASDIPSYNGTLCELNQMDEEICPPATK